MIEIFAIILICWCVYFFATGKHKKEYQEENNRQFKEEWGQLKLDFKKIWKPGIKVETKNHVEIEIAEIKALGGQQHFCKIHYSDFGENFSVRDININNVYQDGKYWYLDAFCHFAEDDRTFRLDRIEMLECKHLYFHSFENKEIGMFLKKNF